MSAEDAFSGAYMSEPQIRHFTTRHLITAREAIKAVMHPAGILVGCTCDPVVALGERRGCYGKRGSGRWLAADREER